MINLMASKNFSGFLKVDFDCGGICILDRHRKVFLGINIEKILIENN